MWGFPNCTVQEYGFYRDGLLHGFGQRITVDTELIGWFENGKPTEVQYYHRIKGEILFHARFNARGELEPTTPRIRGDLADLNHSHDRYLSLCHFGKHNADSSDPKFVVTHWFGECLSGQKDGFGLLFNEDGKLLAAGLWRNDQLIQNKPVPVTQVGLDPFNYLIQIFGSRKLNTNQMNLLREPQRGGAFQYYHGHLDSASGLPHGHGIWYEFPAHQSGICGGEFSYGLLHGRGWLVKSVDSSFGPESHRLEGNFHLGKAHGVLMRTVSSTLNGHEEKMVHFEGFRNGEPHGLSWMRHGSNVFQEWREYGKWHPLPFGEFVVRDGEWSNFGLKMLTYFMIYREEFLLALIVSCALGYGRYRWSRRPLFKRLHSRNRSIVDLSNHHLVLRTLRPDEVPNLMTRGLIAKAPNSILDHIKNGSKPGFISPYISSTSDLAVARKWIGIFRPAALMWVPDNVIDLNSEAARLQINLTDREFIFTQRSKEVLLNHSVPHYQVTPILVHTNSITLWSTKADQLTSKVLALIEKTDAVNVLFNPLDWRECPTTINRFLHIQSVNLQPANKPGHLLTFCGLPNLHWSNQRNDLATQQQLIEQCITEYIAKLLYNLLLEMDPNALASIPHATLFECDVKLHVRSSWSHDSPSIPLDKVGVPTPLLLYEFDPLAERFDPASADRDIVYQALSSTFILDLLLGNYRADEIIFIKPLIQNIEATIGDGATGSSSNLCSRIMRYGFHYCLHNRADDNDELNNFGSESLVKFMQYLLKKPMYKSLNHLDHDSSCRMKLVAQIDAIISIIDRERSTISALLQRIPTSSINTSSKKSVSVCDIFDQRVRELIRLGTLLREERRTLNSTLELAINMQSEPIQIPRRRMAVLWCLQHYTFLEPLPACKHDFDHMKPRLHQLGFHPINCWPFSDSGVHDFLEEWRKLMSELKPNDLLLFYFSGHGFYQNGDLHLCPRDYHRSTNSFTVTIRSLQKDILKVQEQHRVKALQLGDSTGVTVQLSTIFLLDCCSSPGGSTDSSSMPPSSPSLYNSLDPIVPDTVLSPRDEESHLIGSHKSPNDVASIGTISIVYATIPGGSAYAPKLTDLDGENVTKNDCSFFTQGLLYALSEEPPLEFKQVCSYADKYLRGLFIPQRVWSVSEGTPSDEIILLGDTRTSL